MVKFCPLFSDTKIELTRPSHRRRRDLDLHGEPQPTTHNPPCPNALVNAAVSHPPTVAKDHGRDGLKRPQMAFNLLLARVKITKPPGNIELSVYQDFLEAGANVPRPLRDPLASSRFSCQHPLTLLGQYWRSRFVSMLGASTGAANTRCIETLIESRENACFSLFRSLFPCAVWCLYVVVLRSALVRKYWWRFLKPQVPQPRAAHQFIARGDLK